MYFKDFPQFLYDFNYGSTTKTTVVRDITRNVRFKKEVLANISIFDEYDVVDGETPEIISEKFYGTPEYHWIVMLANDKYDWTSDWPLKEDILQKHIDTAYNPTMYSDDWYWDTQVVNGQNKLYVHVRITGGSDLVFDPLFLTAPVKITLYDETKQFVKIINFPTDEIGLDEGTQYFYFPYTEPWDITQFGKPGSTSSSGVGNIRIYADTKGREHNPVAFVNVDGIVVDVKDNPYAIPVTGDELHRAENNQKRRIRIIAPELLEVVIKNYEELLR